MSAPVDKKPEFEEKCKQSCLKYVKEYEACADRVSKGEVHHEGANCSGQFFEMWHCIDKCAVPKIWNNIKD